MTSPIDIFRKEEVARDYARLRTPPDRAMRTYTRLMLQGVNASPLVCDVGAGVGTFARALASSVPGAMIHCVEPAEAMFNQLNHMIGQLGSDKVSSYKEKLSDLIKEQRGQYDLVLASEIIHLFQPVEESLHHLASLVAPGGTLVIRTSSQGQLQRRGWYRFFPSARLIDMARHPSLELVSEVLYQSNFVVSEAVVDESGWRSAASYLELISPRGFSTLRLLDEHALETGTREMRLGLAGNETFWFDYEMTLLIGRRLA